MDGVTTAMVGFIFVCIIFPRLVRSAPQFYAAFGMIVLMLLLSSLAGIFNSEPFWRFVRAVNGLLQLASLILLVISTGGLSINELAGEFKGAFDAIRHGPDAGKPTIVPLTGAQPRPRVEDDEDDDDVGPVHTIQAPAEAAPGVARVPVTPTPPPGAAAAPRRPADDSGAIPLE